MKTRKKISVFFSIALVVVLMTACRSKSFVYLQDMEVGKKYPIEKRYEPIVQCDDRLDITVSAKNPELALPFNAAGGAFSVSESGSVTSVPKPKGYRVDKDGNIDFPILGKLCVAGFTRSEVEDMIRQRIIDGDYIKAPIVSIDFLNFKYSVIGAVGLNNTYTLENGGDRITIFEAIAKAGNLTQPARLDKVGVLREENGNRVLYMTDLRSKEVFNSPCFYLHQNDVIYVEPKYLKSDKEDKTWRYITGILSLIATTCSVIWVTR